MMPAAWYRLLYQAVVRIYYRRIRAVGRQDRPGEATLYVGLHRNGAVDGMVYKALVPRAEFMISEQLIRSAFGRLFFTGIPVAREKDVANGENDDRRKSNTDSLALCVEELKAGGALFILPEGTSDLGPRHLPFKPGVAHILARPLAAGVRVRVVPVGIFYQRPEAFRSDVTVVFGPDVDMPAGEARPRDLMQRITAALEAVGVNTETAEELHRVEVMASLAAEKPGERFHQRLKALESAEMPQPVASAWRRVIESDLSTNLEVPVVSQRGAPWSALWLLIQLPFVIAGFIVNLPVVLGAWAAGRRFADARNTITLWRILIGMPLALVWLVTIATVALVTKTSDYLSVYFWSTFFGLWLYPELRERWPRFRNAFANAERRADVKTIRDWANDVA